MLVKLYEVHEDPELMRRVESRGVTIRRVMAPDIHRVCAFVRQRFSQDWADACLAAALRRDCYVAVREHQIVGFACNEASTLDYFGPIGVLEELRGQEIGHALLRTCLLALKAKGYNYAIIGWVGPAAFYHKCVGATPVEGSIPGAYRNLLSQ